MSISFSGLASGLDTSSWVEALVSVKQQKVTSLQKELTGLQTKKSTVSSTKSAVISLRSALEKITDVKFGNSFDLFSNNTATSSDNGVFTATADSTAGRQSYNILVSQLATYTKATSTNPASLVADNDTLLSELGISKGDLTFYVDGVRNSISVDDYETIGSLRTKFNNAGVDFNIGTDGRLSLSATDPNAELMVGATTDSSNFVSVVGLSAQEDGSYLSTNSLFKASLNSKLLNSDAGFSQPITAGTFTIGNAEFTIDDTTTMASLINEINNSEEAQASVMWDSTSGKLIINSTKEGGSFINIQAGTSNFTDVMGFTSTTWDGDGNPLTSVMLTEAQELGKNAMLSINGTSIVSTSNRISADVSRITGVTINLTGVSTEDENGVINPTKLDVAQNNDTLLEAVKNFVSAYNEVITTIDDVTSNGADLQRDTTLTSFKSTIRNLANSRNDINGGEYTLLSQIGISTGKADANDLSATHTTLEFDEKTFLEALQTNPESVKSILAGNNGILNQIESSVEYTLQSTNGYFDVKTSSLDSEIKKMQEKITKQQSKISSYQTQLENKFYQMELAISQMQQNYSSFLAS